MLATIPTPIPGVYEYDTDALDELVDQADEAGLDLRIVHLLDVVDWLCAEHADATVHDNDDDRIDLATALIDRARETWEA